MRTPSASSAWLHALARQIHFYAGILVAPFITVAAASGARIDLPFSQSTLLWTTNRYSLPSPMTPSLPTFPLAIPSMMKFSGSPTEASPPAGKKLTALAPTNPQNPPAAPPWQPSSTATNTAAKTQPIPQG